MRKGGLCTKNFCSCLLKTERDGCPGESKSSPGNSKGKRRAHEIPET